MTNEQIIKKVSLWQNAGFVHPLTCGNNSQHQNLVAKEVDGKVVLSCLDCNYIQNHIPDYVLEIKRCPQCGVAIYGRGTYCYRCEYFD